MTASDENKLQISSHEDSNSAKKGKQATIFNFVSSQC